MAKTDDIVWFEFVESTVFSKQVGELPAEVLNNIQSDLVQNPKRGDIVKGAHGVRKARVADLSSSRGKSGSYRYLYLYLEHAGRIYLLYLFSKGDQADLSPDQKQIIGALSQQIRKERWVMKTGKTRKAQTNKTNYMSDEAFADLKEAMEDALAFERGKRRDLRVTRIQAPRAPKAMSPRDIARIREKLNCSQAVFAMMLNISPKTVQAWEQGSREPGEAALKLLTIAKKRPEILLEA
jgi:putative transcriptional regulator